MNGSLLDTVAFAPAGRDRWLELALKAAGGDLSTLTSRTDDGIEIEPLYDAAPADRAAIGAGHSTHWTVVQRVDDTDPVRANAQARDDIEGGATGLALVFEEAPNAFGFGLPATDEAMDQALDGIQLGSTYLRIDVHPGTRVSAEWLVRTLGARRVDPSRLKLAFGVDPAALFAGTGRLRMSIEALEASMPQSLAHFFALGVPGVLVEADGRVYHNAGATEAQELGAMIAGALSHLRMFETARQPLLYAAPHIGFAIAVDQDQFVSIAKLRALRRLWSRVQGECGIPHEPVQVHAETPWRMMTSRDPETNILRSTIACFAAAAGGANSVSILPHTIAHGLPDSFARRLARNTQIVLAQESHVGFVADPASGSGAVEALTDALCEAAWAEMQRIEDEGGMLASLAAGAFQSRVRQARVQREADLVGGKRAIVGTTLYPLAQERPVSVLPAAQRPAGEDGVAFCEAMVPARIDQSAGGQP